MAAGKFKDEIIPVVIPSRKGDPVVFVADEHIRTGLTIADLNRLKPIFAQDGTVTAGNVSGLNDGSAIVILANREKANELQLPILGRIHSAAVAGCDPK